MNIGYRKLLAKATALTVLVGSMATAGLAFAQDAQQDESDNEVEPLDEIVTTGIRQSLETASAIKRNSDRIVDAVVAEDIGKLPDVNVAEALQRVTGVQIERDRGEGSRISIRGLSADLNRTEVNGVTFAGTSTSREADFRNIPSQFISKIEVVKSPTASMTEGAVGGWTLISTLRPFERDGGFKAIATVLNRTSTGADTEISDENSPTYNLYLSNTFGEKFGASLTLHKGTYDGRNDIMEDLFWAYFDVDGDTVPEHMPQVPRYFMNIVTEERESATASLQFRPSDRLEFIFDATLSDRKSGIHNYVVNYLHLPGFGTNSNFVHEGDTIVQFDNTLGLFQSLSSEYDEHRETNTYSLRADWQATDDLNITALVGSSDGELNVPLLNVVYNRFNIPVHTMGRTEGDGVWTTTDDLTTYGQNGSDYLQFQSIFSQDRTEQHENLVQLDLEYAFDSSFLNSVEFGVQSRQTEFNNKGAILFRNLGLGLDPLPPGFATRPDLMRQVPGNFGDVYDANPGGIPSTFWVPDTSVFLAANYSDQELKDIGNYAQQYLDAGRVWNIEEDVTAAYLQANFEASLGNMPLSGNLGFRYVKTETTTHGFANTITEGFNDPVSLNGKYDDVLPSLNLALEATDKLVVRLAASKVIARPKITDLVPSLVYNSVTLIASGGNPDLDPFRADQFDLTAEYYGDRVKLMGGFFYKDVKSFVETRFEAVDLFGDGIIYQFMSPQNGKGATIKGLEFAAQHDFDYLPAPFDGFGFIANYTYVDSSTVEENQITGEPLPFPGLSKNSYNIAAYWEKYGFSVRLALNHRSNYLTNSTMFGAGGPTGPQISEGFDDLSLGVGYALNEHVTFTAAGSNLLDNYIRIFSEPGANRNVGTISFGQRYEIGAAVRF